MEVFQILVNYFSDKICVKILLVYCLNCHFITAQVKVILPPSKEFEQSASPIMTISPEKQLFAFFEKKNLYVYDLRKNIILYKQEFDSFDGIKQMEFISSNKLIYRTKEGILYILNVNNLTVSHIPRLINTSVMSFVVDKNYNKLFTIISFHEQEKLTLESMEIDSWKSNTIATLKIDVQNLTNSILSLDGLATGILVQLRMQSPIYKRISYVINFSQKRFELIENIFSDKEYNSKSSIPYQTNDFDFENYDAIDGTPLIICSIFQNINNDSKCKYLVYDLKSRKWLNNCYQYYPKSLFYNISQNRFKIDKDDSKDYKVIDFSIMRSNCADKITPPYFCISKDRSLVVYRHFSYDNGIYKIKETQNWKIVNELNFEYYIPYSIFNFENRSMISTLSNSFLNYDFEWDWKNLKLTQIEKTYNQVNNTKSSVSFNRKLLIEVNSWSHKFNKTPQIKSTGKFETIHDLEPPKGINYSGVTVYNYAYFMNEQNDILVSFDVLIPSQGIPKTHSFFGIWGINGNFKKAHEYDGGKIIPCYKDNNVLVFTENQELKKINAESGSQMGNSLKIDKLYTLEFAKIVFGNLNNQVLAEKLNTFFNIKKGSILEEKLKNHDAFRLNDISGYMENNDFSPNTDKNDEVLVKKNFNENSLIYISKNKTINFYNNYTKSKVSLYIHDKDNWILFTDDNYYYSPSKKLVSVLKFQYKLQYYNFEQFDLYFNRPDIILKRIGITSDSIIQKYSDLYEKRIEKMGFKIESTKVDYEQPIINIKNFDFPFLTKESQIKINIEAFDPKYKLDRLNLYVNDVPWYGINGQNLKNKNTSKISQEVDVVLSSGKNKIEFSVHNEIGIESKRESFEIISEKPKLKPSLYVVTLGVSDYKDKSKDLRYSAKDADDVASFLSTDNTIYGKIETKKLKNQDVLKEEILKIKQVLMKSKVDDKVVLYISGHGILDVKLKEWYYGTHDINFQNPSKKGISYNQLESILDGIPARNKLFLLDACNSGELDKDLNNIISNTKPLETKVYRGEPSTTSSAKNNTLEAMKAIFTDTRRFSGANVISASSGDKVAFEDEKYKNGYFTYAFLEGLKTRKADINNDRKITVSEIRNYIYKRVVDISDDVQSPTNRQENLSNDFVIWSY